MWGLSFINIVVCKFLRLSPNVYTYCFTKNCVVLFVKNKLYIPIGGVNTIGLTEVVLVPGRFSTKENYGYSHSTSSLPKIQTTNNDLVWPFINCVACRSPLQSRLPTRASYLWAWQFLLERSNFLLACTELRLQLCYHSLCWCLNSREENTLSTSH